MPQLVPRFEVQISFCTQTGVGILYNISDSRARQIYCKMSVEFVVYRASMCSKDDRNMLKHKEI